MHPTDNGRKLEDKHENPIDNFLYIFVNKLTPIFHKLGLTPNNITFLSFLCALISFYFFCKKEYRLAALFWGINYFFDHMDGYMARKYKMFSKYGDYYDHLSDLFGGIGLIYLFYRQGKYKEISLIIVLTMLNIYHISCQEEIYGKKNESKTMNVFKLCSDKENIKYTRWFGPGTLNLMIAYLIYITK